MFKKLRLIILLAVFGLPVMDLMAQTTLPTYGDWSQTTIFADQEVLLTGDVSLKGRITISNGKKLTIKSNGAQRTIKLAANLSNMFSLSSNSTLELIGAEGDSLIIDGGANFVVTTVDGYLDNVNALKGNTTTTNYSVSNPAIYVNGATLNMEYTVIQDVNNTNSGSDNNYKGGAIQTVNDNNHVTVKNSSIRRCKSQLGTIINMPNSCKSSVVTFENCDLSYSVATSTNSSYDAGVIRTMGSTEVVETLKNCKIHHNYSRLCGGSIYSNATKNSNCTIDGCEIYMNHASNDGAGIYGGGNMTFEGNPVNIHHNKADRYGGGIGFHTYSGGTPPGGSSVVRQVVGSNVTVHHNYAKEGAGICFIGESSFSINANFEMELDGVTIQDNVATTDGGGFYYRNMYTGTSHTFKAILTDCNIQRNYAEGGNGGGVNILNADIKISGDQTIIADNHSKQGAGFYVDNGKLELSDALIENNIASINGGGFYTTGNKDYILNISDCRFLNNEADQTTDNGHGGGFYSKFAVVIDNSEFEGNKAYNGGGLYVTGKTITLQDDSKIVGNFATYGAGIYANDGSILVADSEITGNEASTNGGGIYANGGTLTVNGGEISGNAAAFGAGGYMGKGSGTGGTLTINGGSVDGNEASVNGGGFYVDGGTFNITDGTIGASGEGNSAVKGGGVYANGGEVNISNGYIQYNTATTGGGFYVQGGTATIEGGTVQNNTASNGGGLYMLGTDGSHKAIANFSNGSFSGNSATTAGGGIYLADYSELNMSGSSAITGNSAGVKGGGVFKTAGNGHSKLQVSGTSLQVVNNTAGGQRNNVYLDSYSDYITVDPVAGISDQVKVGISVNVNSAADLPTPVIHCDDVNKLNDIFNMLKTSTGTSGVFDDASKYLVVYQSHPLPFNDKEIFFIATWIAEVTQPEHFDINNPEISTPDELAWFMVLVNGLNDQSAHPGLNGTVINDIDMSAYFWSPIGEWNHGDEQAPQSIYTGTFDGQGHTISGLSTCGVINYFNYGLFGHTGSTADIKNVVLADCDFTSGEAKRMGNLIAEMDGGTVSNCIVSGKLNPSGSETQENDQHYCVVGGLIGETKNNAIIRNCIATEQIQAEPIDDAEFYPGMQAFTVGGLVGMASAGTVIENCFANPEIHHGGKQGTGTTLSNPNCYVGGLIGENCGTVRNCYVRLERSNELMATASEFGMFAGLNNNTIDCCYYPESSLRNIKVGSTSTPNQPLVNAGSNPTSHGEYNTTVTPYYYKHNDNLVTKIGGETVETPVSLLDKLNEWVGDNATYSHWMRTYASPVNADYPVLEYDNLASTMGYTTIASRDGINMEYNKSLNTMIGKYNTNGSALFAYSTPDEEINKSTAIPLYVGEDVALQLKSGTAITNAYVGITLDNSRQKTVGSTTAKQFNWHMFATPLAAAPLGVNYEGNTTTYNYWNGQTLPQFNFYTESDYDGYFPSKTFGTNADYYDDWDYYCYSEPDYHWINFKRNSASHFHQDTENPDLDPHAQITYENEPTLGKGKGYLLATKEASFLQSHGELNNGDVTITLSKTEEVQECFRGCNLIGNPYQAYLDFNQTGLGSYAILDEDAGGYVAYASRASKNTYPATSSAKGSGVPAPSQYIHMHQGFFVVAASDGQEVTFSPGMCVTNVNSTFRGEEQPAYPLVNLAVTEADGSREFVTIELDRPDNGGAVKMKGLRNGNSLIYTSMDGKDYSIAFMPAGTSSAAVRFETLEEGTFTMNWNTQNGIFSYLHLIDNMTGMDIDCLASDEYKFTASPEDYVSRFKLVFSYTGVEENEAASTNSASFAFMMNGNLVVNGEGMADIFDLTGRLVSSTRLTGVQSTISLPAMAQGVYMVRLTNGNGSKVQKVVIE